MDLRDYVRDIPDFPRDGILFRDITPLLLHPGALDQAGRGARCRVRRTGADRLRRRRGGPRVHPGAAALARELHAGFVPARKPGKLPAETVSAEYALEYGLDALEVHADAFAHGARVLVHDDLLATGGTAGALCELVTGLGGRIVGCAFLIELPALGGRLRLTSHPVKTLIRYD